jgi:hypothetical protein
MAPYEAGSPKVKGGAYMTPPSFKSHYSVIHGRKLTSWSDYHAANRQLGLVDTGPKMRTQKPKIISYSR